jgi:hypothetical protein
VLIVVVDDGLKLALLGLCEKEAGALDLAVQSGRLTKA